MPPTSKPLTQNSTTTTSLQWQSRVAAEFIPKQAEVHLWRVNTAEINAEHYTHLLSPPEVRKAAKYRQKEKQDRFIIGRGVLKELSLRYLNTSHKSLNCVTNRFGKPFFANHHNHLQFNISHTQGIILLAFGFSSPPLGVDIEAIKMDFDYLDIAQQYFTAAEKQSLRTASPAQQFFKIWTRKEALMKALGWGLTDELFALDVLHDPIENCPNYRLCTFALDEHYIFSLAGPIALKNIRCFKY